MKNTKLNNFLRGCLLISLMSISLSSAAQKTTAVDATLDIGLGVAAQTIGGALALGATMTVGVPVIVTGATIAGGAYMFVEGTRSIIQGAGSFGGGGGSSKSRVVYDNAVAVDKLTK